MLNHITLLVNDIERSKAFYSKALEPLGYKLLVKDKDNFNYVGAGYGIVDIEGKRDFWLKESKNCKPRGSISCIAFTATKKEIVDEFYKAAIEAGGTDNGAPGYRPEYHKGYYAAFVLDPNGYNIEVVFDDPAEMNSV